MSIKPNDLHRVFFRNIAKDLGLKWKWDDKYSSETKSTLPRIRLYKSFDGPTDTYAGTKRMSASIQLTLNGTVVIVDKINRGYWTPDEEITSFDIANPSFDPDKLNAIIKKTINSQISFEITGLKNHIAELEEYVESMIEARISLPSKKKEK